MAATVVFYEAGLPKSPKRVPYSKPAVAVSCIEIRTPHGSRGLEVTLVVNGLSGHLCEVQVQKDWPLRRVPKGKRE